MMDDNDFYWDWAKHEEHIFTNRGSFFLLGESMLVVAVATILTNYSEEVYFLLQWIYYTGIFITLIWLLVNTKNIFMTNRMLKNKLQLIEPRFNEIIIKRKWFPSNNQLMGIVLPVGLLGFWIKLLLNLMHLT